MKNILFLFVAVLFSACGSNDTQTTCKSRESCLNDPNCQCWCSQKCGYRKKLEADHPVYVENDPNGKSCYCKQWDVDYYEENCIQGKKVAEPQNAE